MNLSANTHEAYKLFHEGALALAEAEEAGFRLDVDFVTRKQAFLTKKIAQLEDEFRASDFCKEWVESAGGKRVNIHSGDQLANFLYNVKKVEVLKTTKSGAGSTDILALQQMNIPEIDGLLRAKKLKKVRDVYLADFMREQVDGIIHPFYNLNVVRSFRSSSDSPNFQNIPIRDEESMKICRKALFPKKGHQLGELDYSVLEVKVNACINQDPVLVKYVSDPSKDMHLDTARQIFVMPEMDKKTTSGKFLRQATKNGFVFAEFYGDYYKNCAINVACNWGRLPQGKWKRGQGVPLDEGPYTIGDHLISKGFNSIDSFAEHLKTIEYDFWEKRFKRYAQWKEENWAFYKKHGYVELPSGFRCGGIMDKKQVNNYPGQGGGFHCNLWSLIEINKRRKKQKWVSRIIGQIHDSILFDFHPAEVDYIAEEAYKITCKELPQAWKWITVPLDVEMALSPVDASWADKKDYKLNN